MRLCLRKKHLHCFRACLRKPTRTAKYQVNSLGSFIRSSLEYITLVIQKKWCSMTCGHPGGNFQKIGVTVRGKNFYKFSGLDAPPPKGKNYVQTQQYQPCWQIPKWMDISSGISWPSCTKTFSFCQIYVNFPGHKRSGLWFWKNCTTSHCQHSIQLY